MDQSEHTESVDAALDRHGLMADLDEAIALHRRALEAVPPGSPDRAVLLNGLGVYLTTRQMRTGRLEDLEEAIAVFRSTLDAAAPELPDWPGYLTNLGNGLTVRYALTGRNEDLEEAIALIRRARAAVPSGSPLRTKILNNLGNALLARYRSTEQLEDLQEAIAVCRYNLEIVPLGSSGLPVLLANLGNGLGMRYLRTRELEDLQEAIAAHRRAVDAIPEGSPERSGHLRQLGIWLERQYEATDRIEDLAEASAVNREAASLQRELERAAGMSRGTKHPIQVTCPQCGPVAVKTWLIVDLEDIQHRPDLADAIRGGTIHEVACPQCESVLGVVDAPLLLHCPGPEPALVFSPPYGMTHEERRQTADSLVERWRALAGVPAESADPRQIWMPPELLPVVVDEGVEVAEARFAETQPSDPVAAAVLRLGAASAWEEAYLIVRDHPLLLDERAETVLAVLRDRALAVGDEGIARKCEDHVGLLRRCREIGVQDAFGEKLGWTSSDLQTIEAMAQMPPEIHRSIREVKQHEERHRRGGDGRALDAAAACWERILSDPALDLVPVLAKVPLWTDAGMLFLTRYEERGDLADVDSAVTAWRCALESSPPGSPSALTAHYLLGLGLWARCQRTATLEDLEESIALFRYTVDACPPDSPDRQRFLSLLGQCLHLRADRTCRMEHVEEAVEACREAMAMGPTDPSAVLHLAQALCGRYDRTGNLGDLDEAIAICRRAASADSQEGLACLQKLGRALKMRYERLGSPEDVEDAIAIGRRCMDATPLNSLNGPLSRAALGNALCMRYERTGRLEDLDEAIAICRQALGASAPERGALHTLSRALDLRYRRTHQMEDLQECIALVRRVVAASPPGSADHPYWLNSLACSLDVRHSHTGRTEDMDEAIALWREAVEAIPPGSPDRAFFLGNLGVGLKERYKSTGRLEDLHDATAVCRRAVECAPGDAPHRANVLSNLGACLRHHYEHTQRMEDLEEAIAVLRRTAEARPMDSPRMPSELESLARQVHARHERTGSAEDLQEAVALARRALELSRESDLATALRSASALGRWALHRSAWKEAAGAFVEAMTMLDTLCEAQLLRSEKHGWLRYAHTVYPMAAYSLARTGDLQGAVLAMETGRARVLTEMLDRSRADLAEVERQAPELVHRYRQALAEIGRLEVTGASGGLSRTAEPGEHGKRASEQIREARADLHAVVEAIRTTPGGEMFLARPSAPTLAAALEPGVPVIYLAATGVGGITLIVFKSAGGLDVTPLWLDSLTNDAVSRLLDGTDDSTVPAGWLGAYSRWREQPDDREARARWHEQISRTTRALWDLAMGPVVAFFRERFPGIGRAVLIPDGHLALLPLHAAWTEEDGGRQRRHALDEVAFSYAPSVRALGHARDIAKACGQSRLLVVDEPGPTSASPLPNSHHEVETAAAQFARDDVTLLAGEQCHRGDVLAAIAGADICHFACHGTNDWREPLQSGLLMANDEMLTVESLLAMSGRQARLAVLSACETGIVGTAVPNEVVALPSAFLQAGFAGVVASLWSVYDISASLLMARFYELWRGEHLSPAVALRRAQIWLRDLTHRDLAAHLERLVPELAPRMSRETAEALHFRAFLQDPDARPFADPVHWAAFYLTGV